MTDSQILHTPQFGDLRVVMSFHEPPFHVALCENGAYVDINGLPINDKAILRKAIPVEFLQDALDWFDHRHEKEEDQLPLIVLQRDGTYAFQDGSEIKDTSQISQALPPGDARDAVLRWFVKRQIAQEEAESQGQSKAKPSKKMKTKPRQPAPVLPAASAPV